MAHRLELLAHAHEPVAALDHARAGDHGQTAAAEGDSRSELETVWRHRCQFASAPPAGSSSPALADAAAVRCFCSTAARM